VEQRYEEPEASVPRKRRCVRIVDASDVPRPILAFSILKYILRHPVNKAVVVRKNRAALQEINDHLKVLIGSFLLLFLIFTKSFLLFVLFFSCDFARTFSSIPFGLMVRGLSYRPNLTEGPAATWDSRLSLKEEKVLVLVFVPNRSFSIFPKFTDAKFFSESSITTL
jgi:hypothetical protein